MKRLHIHLSVPNLETAIHFYSQMFGQPPGKQKSDYAKWQLDEPHVNFAISTRSEKIGLDHLGIQVSDEQELEHINMRLMQAEFNPGSLEATTCCYAESVKSWSVDPAGIPWESFITMKDAEVYGMDNFDEAKNRQTACCSDSAALDTSASSCC